MKIDGNEFEIHYDYEQSLPGDQINPPENESINIHFVGINGGKACAFELLDKELIEFIEEVISLEGGHK